MENIILTLVDGFSINDLEKISQLISSDPNVSDYAKRIFMAAHTFSWIDDNDLEKIVKIIKEQSND